MAIKGDIVLVNFPFTDLSQTKLRPAIILWVDQAGSDVVLCAITSQNTDRLKDGEFLISTEDPEFKSTGLRVRSKARVTRIVTLNRELVLRKLGRLGENYLESLNTKMMSSFQLS
jgi:mRNA interferase MazF